MKKLLLMMLAVFPLAVSAGEVIKLTQTGCQFLETEGVDHHFTTHSASDCRAINDRTGDKRLAAASTMHLKPGDYIFRVKNRDVPYALGFWLRGAGLSRLGLPSVSGGGIATGGEKDYAISLEPGKYYFSCPLNPTPDYTLIVE
jgi:hypothetical protein